MKMIDIKKKLFGQGKTIEFRLIKSMRFYSKNRQVAMADVLLLNKIDLVNEEEKNRIVTLIKFVTSVFVSFNERVFISIRSINGSVEIHQTIRSK